MTLHRKRTLTDDLYSALNITSKPTIAIYVGASKTGPSHKLVMIANSYWEVEERDMKFYFDNIRGGADVREAC